jgi:hypothetical protein
MAMSRIATAYVQQTSVGLDDWEQTRKNSFLLGGHRSRVASHSLLEKYSPDQFLLTHCTIIASVDVDEMPNVKTGAKVKNAEGDEINRPHPDFLIKPESSQYINCNGDSWERKLLLACYQSFIGAENYVEHIQIPELSKGKVIDAVARDLGDTVYVDILVATNRKHEDLIRRIEAGELSTLSMGCTIQYSICTKCGNIAKDDTELCRHVKYEKGNKFIGPDGKIRVVAELCGHHTDPSSVGFIEASWVGNPAFKGAVMRNILEGGVTEKVPTKYEQADLAKRIEHAHTVVMPDWTDMFRKTASATESINEALKIAFGFGEEEEEETEEETSSPLDDAVNEFKDKVRSKGLKQLRDELRDEDPPKDMPEKERQPNDNILHSYRLFASKYAKELPDIQRRRRIFALLYTLGDSLRFASLKGRFSNQDIVSALFLMDRDLPGREPAKNELYLTLSKVGARSKYADDLSYLKTFKSALGRMPSRDEAELALSHARWLS